MLASRNSVNVVRYDEEGRIREMYWGRGGQVREDPCMFSPCIPAPFSPYRSSCHGRQAQQKKNEMK